MFSPEIETALAKLPDCAGVYEMKNEDNETLYVGKAKNLKNRVKSYFLPSAKHSPRIAKLIEKVHHLEWTETSSELAALVLESNLIKEKRPKFNILLRDDKNFAYIRFSVQEDFPRLELVRKVQKDGAKYFGPKVSSSAVRQTIDLLNDIFQFRTTPLELHEISENNVEVLKAGNTKFPCLNFHLKKCLAPCIGGISKKLYGEKVEKALKFLKGETAEIVEELQNQMMDCAKTGKFEQAARRRDQMLAIKSISEKQVISAPDEFSADIIGVHEQFDTLFFHIFSARSGKIINSETFHAQVGKKEEENLLENQKEGLKSFLRSYSETVADFPKSIVLSQEIFLEEEKAIWEEFFLEKWGQKVEISLPKMGKRKELLLLAEQNAESFAKRNVASFLKQDEDEEKSLKILQEKFGLLRLPKRMECFDISHFSGEKTVASMVVFENGKPKVADYRSFNINLLPERKIDDFASIAEALSRRLARLPQKFPEDWKVEKMKKFPENFSPIPNQYSEIFFDAEKKLQKKTEVFFVEFSQKLPLPLRGEGWGEGCFASFTIHHLSERTEIFLPPLEDQKQQQFFLENSKKWMKGTETIFFADENWREVLEKNACVEDFSPPLEGYPEGGGWFEETKNEPKNRIENSAFFSASTKPPRLRHPSKGGEEICFKIQNSKFKISTDSFSKIPDVIVIDGGKGQLSSAWEVLSKTDYADEIFLCSLAKREEEVFAVELPHPNPLPEGEGKKLDIKKSSPEGHLLQRLRDEAHRFAITKNRVGREKNAIKSALDDISGIGAKTKKLLKEKIGSVAKIKSASDEELLQIVSEKVLVQLRKNL